MKTTAIKAKSANGHQTKVRFADPNGSLFPAGPPQSLIQWPTEQQIQDVSRRLAKINRMGIRWEANGDYFNSGDLAYQLQEIIRSTAELFKKIQRIKR
jgi:hypothetical protein